MKNCTHILAVALLSCSFAFSDQESESAKQAKPQQHRVYIGPDVFVDHSQAEYTYRGDRISIKCNTVYGGLRVGYDYLKPQAFYFGMDGLVAIGRGFFKNNSIYWSDDHFNRVNQKVKDTRLFANLEQRYGYTFQSPISPKSTLTPFAGMGWYYGKSRFHNEFASANWYYAAAGLRVIQQFCANFDAGFNLKAMYIFTGSVRDWSRLDNRKIWNIWGYEMAMPFTWHVGESKKWDLQLQPYLLKIDINTTGWILGARFQAGYNF